MSPDPGTEEPGTEEPRTDDPSTDEPSNGEAPTGEDPATRALGGATTSTKRARRPDASMDLLNQIIRQPVDPDYALVAARGAPPSRHKWKLALVVCLSGLLITLSALQTSRQAPLAATERQELISRIHAEEGRQDDLRNRVTTLQEDVSRLRSEALGRDEGAKELQAEINRLEPIVGQAAVKGPGLLIIVDDAPDGSGEDSRVFDVDLQVMVNGLWSAGAEAIAVNGHRLSNLTAIRGAGDAITVDYRSLTRPYRIEAIGDPKTLQARYVESDGGAWWNYLAQNFQMRYEMGESSELVLGNDPGMVLRYAEAGSP